MRVVRHALRRCVGPAAAWCARAARLRRTCSGRCAVRRAAYRRHARRRACRRARRGAQTPARASAQNRAARSAEENCPASRIAGVASQWVLQLLRHWCALLHAPDHEPHGHGPTHPHGGEIAVPRLQAAGPSHGAAPCEAVRVRGMEELSPSRGPEHPRLATRGSPQARTFARARGSRSMQSAQLMTRPAPSPPCMGRCFYSARVSQSALSSARGKTVFILRVAGLRSKCAATRILHIAHFDHFSPTYSVPSGTSRAKSGRVFAAKTTTNLDLCVAGRTGPNAAGIMPKVHDM